MSFFTINSVDRVVEVQDGDTYIGMGQFATREAAEATLERISDIRTMFKAAYRPHYDMIERLTNEETNMIIAFAKRHSTYKPDSDTTVTSTEGNDDTCAEQS